MSPQPHPSCRGCGEPHDYGGTLCRDCFEERAAREMREEIAANERVLTGYNMKRFKQVRRKQNRTAAIALRFVEFALAMAILLCMGAAEASAQTKLEAKVVSAWSGGSNLQLVETESGTIIFGDGQLTRKDVGIITAACEGGYRLKARTSFFEPRTPLKELPDGLWLLDAAPGKYLIELVPFSPSEDDAEIVLEIPPAGPTPPDPGPGPDPGPKPPDNPQPDPNPNPVPPDEFNNLGQRIAFYAAKMPASDRAAWHRVYSELARKMNALELISVSDARTWLNSQSLTCSDPAVCRALHDLLRVEAGRLGSVGWRTAINFYEAVSRGFAP